MSINTQAPAQPSDQEIENLAMANGILKSQEHWGVRYYTNKGSDLFRFSRALLARYGAAGREIERNNAAACAEPPPAPDGWKLVPVEPTSEMLQALSGEWHSSRQQEARVRYADMLTAAPNPEYHLLKEKNR